MKYTTKNPIFKRHQSPFALFVDDQVEMNPFDYVDYEPGYQSGGGWYCMSESGSANPQKLGSYFKLGRINVVHNVTEEKLNKFIVSICEQIQVDEQIPDLDMANGMTQMKYNQIYKNKTHIYYAPDPEFFGVIAFQEVNDSGFPRAAVGCIIDNIKKLRIK